MKGVTTGGVGHTFPHYLSYYADALTRERRRAPRLRRRCARELGWTPGNASRLALDQLLAVRDFLNEGGRVLYTGPWAGSQYTRNVGRQV